VYGICNKKHKPKSTIAKDTNYPVFLFGQRRFIYCFSKLKLRAMRVAW
jgi:hypothetical protein